SFPRNLVKEILVKAWNVINDIEVTVVDKNIFMFSFLHEADIHGLPLNKRSKENVLKIGSIAGKALDTDLIGPGSGIWSKSVRVRVELDIRCPLVPAWNVINDIEVTVVDKNIFMFSFLHEADIHGLPLNKRSKENVLKIGSIAGKALDTDLIGPGSGIWSKSVRVRVELDIRCPLVPGFPLERDNLP
ncbi:hypothetical protein CFP56_027399, partial [Quercus suber]